MKNITSIFILVISSIQLCNAQCEFIATKVFPLKSNLGACDYTLYSGIANEVILTSDCAPCQDINVSIDSVGGTILRKDCHFYITPSKGSEFYGLDIYIDYQSETDTINFNVVSIPTPQIEIHGFVGSHYLPGPYTLDYISLRTEFSNIDVVIDSFNYSWIRNDSVLITCTVQGAYFNEEMRKRFSIEKRSKDTIQFNWIQFKIMGTDFRTNYRPGEYVCPVQ